MRYIGRETHHIWAVENSKGIGQETAKFVLVSQDGGDYKDGAHFELRLYVRGREFVLPLGRALEQVTLHIVDGEAKKLLEQVRQAQDARASSS